MRVFENKHGLYQQKVSQPEPWGRTLYSLRCQTRAQDPKIKQAAVFTAGAQSQIPQLLFNE